MAKRQCDPTSGLPRSIERGPVEALPDQREPADFWQSFRAQLSAAPLKRHVASFCRAGPGVLPRSIERGPVEAEERWFPVLTTGLAFRAQLSAAPLKRSRPGEHPAR